VYGDSGGSGGSPSQVQYSFWLGILKQLDHLSTLLVTEQLFEHRITGCIFYTVRDALIHVPRTQIPYRKDVYIPRPPVTLIVSPFT
jgi:hypothetical protein